MMLLTPSNQLKRCSGLGREEKKMIIAARHHREHPLQSVCRKLYFGQSLFLLHSEVACYIFLKRSQEFVSNKLPQSPQFILLKTVSKIIFRNKNQVLFFSSFFLVEEGTDIFSPFFFQPDLMEYLIPHFCSSYSPFIHLSYDLCFRTVNQRWYS